jgi:hypothetical protein
MWNSEAQMRDLHCGSRAQASAEKMRLVKTSRGRLQQHREGLLVGDLSSAQYWDYVRCVSDLQSDIEALPILDALIDRHPDHVGALAVRGGLRLVRADHGGVADLEAAMDLDPRLTVPLCEVLRTFWNAQGTPGGFERHRARLAAFERESELAWAERRSLTEAATLEPHGRDGRAIASLQAALASEAGLSRAWLVRKRVSHFPQDPLYVLVVDFPPHAAVSTNLLHRMSERLPTDVCGLIVQAERVPGLLPRLETMDGALIFRRG